MESEKLHEFSLNFTESSFSRVDFNFRPIKIRVYKNGDNHDEGKLIAVTRREFKHWVVFLDGLTEKLETATAVHRLYTLNGIRIDHFDELENNGEYVAVERGPFINCSYGKYRSIEQADRKWTSLVRIMDSKPTYLNSGDSIDLYLRKEGYGSYTGLPYPLDGAVVKSPSTYYMSNLSTKFFGSTEQLKKIEPSLEADSDLNPSLSKEEEDKSVAKAHVASMTKLPKLIGLEDEKEQKNKTFTQKVNQSKPSPAKKIENVLPKYDKYRTTVKGEQPKESRIPIKLEQVQQKERQTQSQDVSDTTTFESHEPQMPHTSLYKTKESHKIITEITSLDPKRQLVSTLWEMDKKPIQGSRTKVIRTYENIEEYRRIIDDYDPDLQ